MPPADVPTLTINAVLELLGLNTLTCNLYSLFTTVSTDWYAAELFKFNLPLPLEV